MTIPHNPLFVAEKAAHMAERTKGSHSEMFQKVAMVSMCVVAVTSAMHLMTQIYRDLHKEDRRKDERTR